ncbi:MAG TPA: diphthine--ammonia ligase [Candidatus Acidoferrum sp.]|nr:diphthine--ammonia ligase [Candidatus Acidoferrum sp.]
MIAALYSGGKDSTLAIHKMAEKGKKTDLLISAVSENEFSYMFHRPNIKWTKLQAEAMGIRQVFFNTKGEKEKELVDIENALKENEVTELITGAVASRYQADRINEICKRLGITHHAPLWGTDPLSELNEISKTFNAIIVNVSAAGLDESFLGARINEQTIDKLVKVHNKYKINLSFEGGEAESFVLDAPLFKKSIKILKFHKTWSGSSGSYVIDDASLESK